MSDPLADLPDDVRGLIAPHVPDSPAMLDAISISIAARRDEAKAARGASGIEEVWRECEEAYNGIDDANRGAFQNAHWSKPMSMTGPVTTGSKAPANDYKSTAFIPLTRRYVDAGAAKLGEILLPADDKAFSFSEMPVPELLKAKKDTSQVVHDGLGNIPLTRAAKPGETPATAPAPIPAVAASPVPPASAVAPAASATAPAGGAVLPAGAASPVPPQVPLTVQDLAEEAIELARSKAKTAETRVYNWMIETCYAAEMRKVIFDSARLGVGVLKAPFPKSKRGIAVSKPGEGDAVELQIVDRIIPAAASVDPWNIFPDPACGENIHDGDYILERDHLAERQVRDLKKIPGYIGAQIDKVLEEGPDKANVENGEQGKSGGEPASKTKGRFEVWYYYGSLKREEMSCICEAAGQPLTADDVPDDHEQVYAIVTLINDTAIRATVNPLDSGEFPYHSVPWQRRAGQWAGAGIAEQIRVAQKMLNASTRAMLNNAGKSAGSIIVVDQGSIIPADGSWILTPDKIFYKKPDSTGQDVRQAVMAIEIPNVTDQLMKINEYAQQLAEESTSIPLVTQGQSGETTPDTFGATQLQNNNANQLLRAIGYSFDDYITEPVVRQYYEWLLLDPDVPDEEKGEFTINAHGSIALVERAIADQTIAQMGPLVLNPVYGFDPKKWAKLMVKSKRLDPGDLTYTEEQQAKIDAAPPVQAPAVQAATIAADAQIKLGVMKQQGDAQSIQSEERIEQAFQELEGKKVAVKATVDLHDIQMRHQLAMLDHANSQGLTLAQVKAELAKTAMTLDTQKQLNAADNAVDLHKHHNPQAPKPPRMPPGQKPLAQVPGRAPNGRAMAQT